MIGSLQVAVRAMVLAGLVGASVVSTGCAAAKPVVTGSCIAVSALAENPMTGTANHGALSPGNQVQFSSGIETFEEPEGTGVGCPTIATLTPEYAGWTNPDPINIQISSANDATNGTAICKGPTAGAITLTSSYGTGSTIKTATVQLTCQ